MKIKIDKKYLIFPVNVLTSKKKVTFSDDGKTVYELMMNLDKFIYTTALISQY